MQRVVDSALPLLRSNISSTLTHFTGLTIDYERASATKSDLTKKYLDQRRSKDILRDELQRLSAEVCTESSHPLIFIVDELDRCRPTFAVELLERVKHIFDVPNLVFIFGLNRDELSKSLQSIYGQIDSSTYLRRFFDFEFNLQNIDSRVFAEQLIDRFRLVEVFENLNALVSDQIHMYDYQNYRTVLPRLWSALDFSLRDIDYGVRLLALLARSLQPGTFTHPFLLVVLLVVKFKKPELYRSLISGISKQVKSSTILTRSRDETWLTMT